MGHTVHFFSKYSYYYAPWSGRDGSARLFPGRHASWERTADAAPRFAVRSFRVSRAALSACGPCYCRTASRCVWDLPASPLPVSTGHRPSIDQIILLLLSRAHLDCSLLSASPFQAAAAPCSAAPAGHRRPLVPGHLQAAAPCEQPAGNRRPLKAAGRRPLQVACRRPQQELCRGTYCPFFLQIKHHGSPNHIVQWSQL